MAISLSLSPKTLPPITISTTPTSPHQLSLLLSTSSHSPHRFPSLTPSPPPIHKLQTAIDHSFITVSVYCKQKHLNNPTNPTFKFEDMFEMMGRRVGSDQILVGFGRAVSDGGLTASIHDVVVTPELRRLGIGRRIVDRIVRVLTNRGIYDISALCSEEERLFFRACRFGDDTLGATTMMYTRTAASNLQDCSSVRSAGQMLLLVPPVIQPSVSKNIDV